MVHTVIIWIGNAFVLGVLIFMGFTFDWAGPSFCVGFVAGILFCMALQWMVRKGWLSDRPQ